MSNQFMLWAMLIFPWTTLFLMPVKDIRRYMPQSLFTIVTSSIIVDAGYSLSLWTAGENIYPLNHLMVFVLGPLPAFTMWIYKFTYGRYWLYAVAELVLGAALAYEFFPWMNSRGILMWVNGGPGITYLITIVHWNIVYMYQVWQERGLVNAETGGAVRLRPALLKRIFPPRKD